MAQLGGRMWLKNCWYVIAWDHEIPAEGFLARTVIGEPLLVYRTSGGEYVVLEDRCCHRHAPLSLGRREGDCIRCGYHGLRFDAQGACVEVPGLDRAPANLKVRTYPVVEHHRWVFVWMGDPARADRALLPDNFSNDHPEWHTRPGYLHYETPWLLICDNLLDFSHLSYVHEKTLGGSLLIAQTRPDIERIDGPGPRGLRISRRMSGLPAPSYYHRIRPLPETINRWFIYDFLFPATLLMNSGGRPIGDAEGDNRNAVLLHSCQTLTPETETSTHYFFQQAYRGETRDETIVDGIHRNVILAFNEDRDMITAQYRNIGRDPQKPMAPLWMDSALMQFRRMLEEAVAAENAAA